MAYSVLSELQAPAAASNEPGPGPLLSNAECTSGGNAIHMGVITTADLPQSNAIPLNLA
jgi:hypothetical protein